MPRMEGVKFQPETFPNRKFQLENCDCSKQSSSNHSLLAVAGDGGGGGVRGSDEGCDLPGTWRDASSQYIDRFSWFDSPKDPTSQGAGSFP
jgi:hypothetical protein